MSNFSEDDLRILEKTLQIRERMVDTLTKGELPTKARDVDSLNNLLESMDRSVLGRAKINIEGDANGNAKMTNEIMKNLLLEMHSNPVTTHSIGGGSIPEFKGTGITLNPGETLLKIDASNASEIIGE